MMKILLLLAISCLTMSFSPSNTAFAVTYLWQDAKGAHVYSCNRFCGKVKVKKTATGVFRVYSIPYSGDLKASSEKQAAMKACKEIEMGDSRKNTDAANRNGNACGR